MPTIGQRRASLRAKRGRTCCSRPAWRWAGTRGKTVFVQVGKVKPFSDVGGRHMVRSPRFVGREVLGVVTELELLQVIPAIDCR